MPRAQSTRYRHYQAAIAEGDESDILSSVTCDDTGSEPDNNGAIADSSALLSATGDDEHDLVLHRPSASVPDELSEQSSRSPSLPSSLGGELRDMYVSDHDSSDDHDQHDCLSSLPSRALQYQSDDFCSDAESDDSESDVADDEPPFDYHKSLDELQVELDLYLSSDAHEDAVRFGKKLFSLLLC